MNFSQNKKGFSLTEVLLAIATLTIGMTFVSGTFLAGVYLSTLSSERTIAAVVADEAFAKIKLFGINPSDPNLSCDQMQPFQALTAVPVSEFAYPSTVTSVEKQYYWAALCREVSTNPANRLIQVTVFVNRKVVGDNIYPGQSEIPLPVEINVTAVSGNTLRIIDTAKQSFVDEGYTIVENSSGRTYRVLERPTDVPDTIVLDSQWQSPSAAKIWVVPPAINGNKNPCIAVFQKTICF